MKTLIIEIIGWVVLIGSYTYVSEQLDRWVGFGILLMIGSWDLLQWIANREKKL